MAAMNEKISPPHPRLLSTFTLLKPKHPTRPRIMLRINEIGRPSVTVEMTKPSDFQCPPIKLYLKGPRYYKALRKHGESASNPIDLTRPLPSGHKIRKSQGLALRAPGALPSGRRTFLRLYLRPRKC
ncbi:hypothetical protein MMC13_000837 [Lambiella insularis]|nr:hypothetical protein [Lambiella insularis]